MTASDKCLDIIKEFEGLKLTAYQDVAGIWTIGFGHTGPEVVDGLQWTQEQANLQLACDVQKVEDWLNEWLLPKSRGCTQNEFDACADAGFNLGVGALRQILSHGWQNVPYQLYHKDPDGSEHGWIHAGKKIVPGLVRRRQAEAALFNTP